MKMSSTEKSAFVGREDRKRDKDKRKSNRQTERNEDWFRDERGKGQKRYKQNSNKNMQNFRTEFSEIGTHQTASERTKKTNPERKSNKETQMEKARCRNVKDMLH